MSIDPGEHAGIALFEDGLLVRAEYVVGSVDRGWRWLGPFGAEAVVEVPQSYPGEPVRPQNLITLAVTAGYLVGAVRPSTIRRVHPREWKGQRPKSIDNEWTAGLLSVQERQIALESGAPASRMDNVWDAIGLGLWVLKRR